MGRLLLIVLALTPMKIDAAESFDLRLDDALLSEDSKPREWVRSPRLRFTLEDGKATLPVIELKRGWVVPSWKGVVESIKVSKTDDGKLKGSVEAQIHSSIGIKGSYSFDFDATVDGDNVKGTYVSRNESGETKKGDLSGTFRDVPEPRIDPDESVWTVQLTKSLPKQETLTVYLNRSEGKFTSAFAYSPNVSRRPMDVDASKLRFADGELLGSISVNRLNVREPDGGERTVFGIYEVDIELAGSGLRGRHSGETVDGVKVDGEVWGEIRPRRDLSPSTKVWFKLEDGYSGGAMWQNRVFFKGTLSETGQLSEGVADNNKGVFEAKFTAADIELSQDRVTGTLNSTVHKSGSVNTGDYTFRLDGQRAGDVLYGRFYTSFEGKEDHSGYFVGGITP